ncbi:IclR family transcriptional regulator domain-containing protein [Arthrobacter koreensis]|uniref:IclR family transcriptional regulator domain-containing protein n=1 Tax=Arthrobacter koreensis TaxID=199136 RepID=UPI002DB73775|nr:IclR family transcriptional regulator C-terminal domain-containing protein [Arthrobacter koreensis]MEB7505501.1 helix-turn-helix domain-containing protein [Arthrobacter koreensis]
MSRENPEVIDSVAKALALLEVFSVEESALTISRAAALTGLTRPTARRILLTLTNLGFAVQNEGRFSLTPKVLRLGFGYLASLPFWETAQPHLRQLAQSVGESCSMATLDGDEIVYLARIPAQQSVAIPLSTGSRLPAYATSLGKVMLATLSEDEFTAYLERTPLDALTPQTITDPELLRREIDQVRSQGFAIVDGEREVGVRSAAAPVHLRDGRTPAAINLSANGMRVSKEQLLERFVPELLRTAGAISSELGYATVL